MPARAPLDVDLEDRLIYGLSPLHFGYLVLSGLLALAAWSSPWPAPVRVGLALLCALAGSILAWGGWRGRPLDAWAVDLATYLARNYCIELRPGVRSALDRALARPRAVLNRRRHRGRPPPQPRWLR
ncbi:MAG: hypothetical protein ACREPA_12310 [Candidatus Dormibacteraceae bacterium]